MKKFNDFDANLLNLTNYQANPKWDDSLTNFEFTGDADAFGVTGGVLDFVGPEALGTPTEWLNEIQVNIGTADIPAASQPHIIGLSNGNFLVAWVEPGTNGVGTTAGLDIIGKIFDAEGGIVRDSYRLNSGRNGDNETDFDIAATNDGGFIIVYMDNDISTPGDTDVIYQRHNDIGNANGTVEVLTETSANFTFTNPQIVVNLQDNTSVLQFQSGDPAGDVGVFLRELDDAGVIVSSSTVNDDAAEDEFDGDIAMFSNGNIISVWTDENGATDDGIQYRIQQTDGTQVAGPFQVDATGRNAQVTTLANGNAVIVWENYDGNSGDISARIIQPGGAAFGTISITSGASNQNEPDVVALPDGDFIVVWDDDTSGDLFARRYNSNGTADGGVFTVENVGTTQPAVSVTGDGRILFTWIDQSTNNVFTSIWDPRSSSIDGDDYNNNTTNFLDTTVLTSLTTSSTVTGTNANDTILGQNGNDILIGGSGEDIIRGGNGNDVIRGGFSTDEVFGDAGNDRFEVFNGEFSDNVDGGTGTDILDLDARTSGTGANVDLRAGTWTLQGPANTITDVETVLGTQLADTLRGNSGSSLFGNGGNDTIIFGSGDGFPDFNGGAGSDTADFSLFGSITDMYVDLSAGGYVFGSNLPGTFDGVLISFENYLGSAGDDGVNGSSANNTITTNDGNDVVNGLDGNDNLSGGNGNDTLRGGGNDDFVSGGNGNDTILGNAGIDTLTGGAGADLIIGGGGNDTINGGNDDDTLSGQGGNDLINGGSGVDDIRGGAGSDSINGEGGNDVVLAGGGNDTVTGGANDDNLSGGSGIDNVSGGTGNDTIFGNNQNDTLFGDSGNDIIDGGGGNDIVNGGAGNDTLSGGASQDTILGGADNDFLFGNSGGDILDGGTGNDRLEGGGGNDTMTGGAGADIFDQDSGFRTDRITDFQNGVDLIDFSGNGSANNFAQVLAAASQVGATVRIELNANNILVLESFSIADLDASDFIF